jgi:hypothetical protein
MLPLVTFPCADWMLVERLCAGLYSAKPASSHALRFIPF